MFELSVGASVFVLLLVSAPILLRNRSQYRNYIFLILNLVLYMGVIKGWQQGVVVALWVLIPYFVVKNGNGRVGPRFFFMGVCDWVSGPV